MGEGGGFSAGVGAVCRALSAAGAEPIPLHHPEESEQAIEANNAGVDCYIGLRLEPDHSLVRTMHYKGYRYESETSRRLAELLRSAILAQGLSRRRRERRDGVPDPAGDTDAGGRSSSSGRPITWPCTSTEIAAAVVTSLEQWLRVDWDNL